MCVASLIPTCNQPCMVCLPTTSSSTIKNPRSVHLPAGPAFIKWGQWAATRHDLFPPDMCAELELLHTQAPAHKFAHTSRAIEAAFGMPVADLFEAIEQVPVASGSIGQIHRARLSEKGAALTGGSTAVRLLLAWLYHKDGM